MQHTIERWISNFVLDYLDIEDQEKRRVVIRTVQEWVNERRNEIDRPLELREKIDIAFAVAYGVTGLAVIALAAMKYLT